MSPSPVRWLIAGLAMTLLSACSKTVTWEEEVPLNTGEVIWVERSMPWVYKGGFGNPFDMAMRPTGEQTIRFEYDGSNYSFTGRIQIILLAISSSKKPLLIALPGSYGWNFQYENSFYCVTPYYVQLSRDALGEKWIWPNKIDELLYGLPANLMVSFPELNDTHTRRYRTADRNSRDSAYRLQSPYAAKIDPLYHGNGNCPKSID